jgi:hypothetical protein
LPVRGATHGGHDVPAGGGQPERGPPPGDELRFTSACRR